MTIARVAAAVVRRRLLVLAITAVVVATSIALASRLRLVTDLAELLPRTSPAVTATEQIQERMGGVSALQIAIESPDRDANLRYARALVDAFDHERARLGASAYDVREERAFFDRTWWLYVDRADLEQARARIARRLALRKNPLFVDLGDGDHDELADLEDRLKKAAEPLDRFPDNQFATPDGHLVVVLLWPPEGMFREHAGEAVVARVEEIIAAHPHPGLAVNLAGAMIDTILERRALEDDLAKASVACVLLVSLVVGLFYGRARAIPLMAAPALCGVAIALAVAELAFGQLNASTAFLGSIIVGNGINAAIIQLARYEEERRAGTDIDTAIQRSVTGTIRATGTAAFAAAIAYASLALTSFRGFSQFGVVGGVGMVASWVATILVLPALLATIDRRRKGGSRGVRYGAPFARLAGHARVVTVIGLGLTLIATIAAVRFLRDPFEYDLRKLRSDQGVERRALVTRIGTIFGTFTPTVLLAKDRQQAAEVADVIRDRARTVPGVIGRVSTVDSLLPGDLAEQRAKLAILDDLRTMLEQVDDPRLARWRPPPDLRPITVADLPQMLIRPFRDVHGDIAPVVLVYRAANTSFWNGRELLRLADLVDRVELPDRTVVDAGGSVVVFADMIEAIEREGPLATLASLLGVAALVVLLARGRSGAVVVLLALITGVIWMVGAAALLGVRINFLNFIALPLTFGIGVDYAVNIYLGYRKTRHVRRALEATGGAVVLCSMTTTLGYASLLFASSQGLRSFGMLAILGELACLSVAICVVPAWLILRRASRRDQHPTDGDRQQLPDPLQ